MWTEAVVKYFIYYLGILIQELTETTKNLSG